MNHYEQLALGSEVVSSLLFAAFLVFGFVKWLTPAVAKAQAVRNEELISAEHRRDDAKAELERARAERSEIEASLLEMNRRAVNEAETERERIVAEARAEGERQIRNADGELERARFTARETFRSRLLERAVKTSRERAQSQIDASLDGRIVANFVNKMPGERELAAAGEGQRG